MSKKKYIFVFKIIFISIYIFIAFLFVFRLKTNKDITFQVSAPVLLTKNVFLQDDIEKELTDNIENQIEDLDFSKLNNIVNNLDETEKNFFGSNSFVNLVKSFIYGQNSNNYNNFLTYLISTIFKEIFALLPYFALIIFISVIYSLLGQFSSNSKVSIKNIVYISCFAAIALIVIKIIFNLLLNSRTVINSISMQMEALFPILLTLITAIGGTVTATTFQPLLAILTTIITKIFVTILIPVFIFSLIFNIVGNISNNIKFDKFSKFFSSLFNWSTGIIFTIFISFLAIQGLTVSSIDGISIKTAKYALKSYIPILGSYLSDGVGLILTSSSLIKNSVGVTGLILLFSTIISPIINIIIVMLLFKLVAALVEPLCDDKISSFLYSVSKSLNLLNVSLIAIGFMYLVSTSILLLVSNIF